MGTVRFQGEHFMVTIQNYVRAKSLEEAYELNQKKGNCILGALDENAESHDSDSN